MPENGAKVSLLTALGVAAPLMVLGYTVYKDVQSEITRMEERAGARADQIQADLGETREKMHDLEQKLSAANYQLSLGMLEKIDQTNRELATIRTSLDALLNGTRRR